MERRVLVVDDHDDGRDALCELLEATGFVVEKAATGSQAVRVALQFQPDVAIVDLGLPEMNGYELAQQFSEGGGERPYLIALTGWTGKEVEQRAHDAGFDYFALKPWRMDEMLALLRSTDTIRRRTSG